MTTIACVSVHASRAPLPLMDRLAVPPAELEATVADLGRATGSEQVAVLSTCERTEVYAAWPDTVDPAVLVDALASTRGAPLPAVRAACAVQVGAHAVRHLLRVTAGLDSFVLGETDIVGQVRRAAEASRRSRAGDVELERLMAAAVNTSRRVHRHTSLGHSGRSVAAAAVDLAAARAGGSLRTRHVVVVGAGQVGAAVVTRVVELGGTVTVCNRTRRHADRYVAAGATVVDLARLYDALATADVAIVATAASHPLVVAHDLSAARARTSRDLLMVDLCLPRNIDPDVGAIDGVHLVDLAGLRAGDQVGEAAAADLEQAEQIVSREVERYLRWLVHRSAAPSVRRLRADLEACARVESERATRGLPVDVQALVDDVVRRAVHRLGDGPTRRLVEATAAGDTEAVELLTGLFATGS